MSHSPLLHSLQQIFHSLWFLFVLLLSHHQFFPPTSSPTLNSRQQVGWPPNETTDSMKSEGWWCLVWLPKPVMSSSSQGLEPPCLHTAAHRGMATHQAWCQHKQNRNVLAFDPERPPTPDPSPGAMQALPFAAEVSPSNTLARSADQKESERDDLEVPFYPILQHS